VDATQEGQVVIVERLDADGQSVDAERPKRRERLPGDGAWVGLERDLGAGRDAEGCSQTGEHDLDLARREERWRPAPEKNRFE
jgi:hypothetical protein